MDFSRQKENKLKTRIKISQLLTEIWKLIKVVVIHGKGHQKVKDTVTLGNHKAIRTSPTLLRPYLAEKNNLVKNLESQHEIPSETVLYLYKGPLHFTEEEIKQVKQDGADEDPNDVWSTPNNWIIIPLDDNSKKVKMPGSNNTMKSPMEERPCCWVDIIFPYCQQFVQPLKKDLYKDQGLSQSSATAWNSTHRTFPFEVLQIDH